jgi:hypothetical protein
MVRYSITSSSVLGTHSQGPESAELFLQDTILGDHFGLRQPTQMPCSPSANKAFDKKPWKSHDKSEISDGPSQDALRLVRKRRRLNDT